jgi:Uma2 family endonuclease
MHAAVPNRIDIGDEGELIELVRKNPTWKIEVSREGAILMSPLTGTNTGPKEFEAGMQLAQFARIVGGRVFSSSSGFRLPDKSLRGPDAAWISAEKLAALTPQDKSTAFWRVCPEVAVEVMSEWDTWRTLCDKIESYIVNGARYAVAIDCAGRTVFERGTLPDGLSLDFDKIFDA